VRQCHVCGLLQKELRSIIKKIGYYCIQGVMCVLPKAREVIDEKESVLLPMVEAATTECSVKRTQLQCVPSESASANPKKSRQGRGTHGLTIVRQLLLDRENWKIIQSKH